MKQKLIPFLLQANKSDYVTILCTLRRSVPTSPYLFEIVSCHDVNLVGDSGAYFNGLVRLAPFVQLNDYLDEAKIIRKQGWSVDSTVATLAEMSDKIASVTFTRTASTARCPRSKDHRDPSTIELQFFPLIPSCVTRHGPELAFGSRSHQAFAGISSTLLVRHRSSSCVWGCLAWENCTFSPFITISYYCHLRRCSSPTRRSDTKLLALVEYMHQSWGQRCSLPAA